MFADEVKDFSLKYAWKKTLFNIFITRVYLAICSHHVTYAFQSESTLYSCLNVKELLAQKKHKIWSLSDFNWPQTCSHLVCKRILNHLAKLAIHSFAKQVVVGSDLQTKWLWVQVQFQSLFTLEKCYWLV